MTDSLGAVLLQAQPGGLDPSFMLMLGSIFLIFYMLVIRPENRRRKDHEASVKGAERGDEVTTSGGLRGMVMGTTDDIVTVEIAKLQPGRRQQVIHNRQYSLRLLPRSRDSLLLDAAPDQERYRPDVAGSLYRQQLHSRLASLSRSRRRSQQTDCAPTGTPSLAVSELSTPPRERPAARSSRERAPLEEPSGSTTQAVRGPCP